MSLISWIKKMFGLSNGSCSCKCDKKETDTDDKSKPLSGEDEEAVKERLKSLGYM